MEDFEKQISVLREQSEANRYNFVISELQSCRNSIEMGHLQLGLGEREVASDEICDAKKAMDTIEHFKAKLDSGQRMEVDAKLAEIKELLRILEEAYKD